MADKTPHEILIEERARLKIANRVGNHFALDPRQNLPVCLICGSVYMNLLAHVRWHEALEKGETE